MFGNLQRIKSTIEDCAGVCNSEFECDTWNFIRNESYYDYGTCFLHSQISASLINQLGISNHSVEIITKKKQTLALAETILLNGPLPVDTGTVVNFPQRFERGCSYTISMWVWLWRKEHPPVHEIPIFTTTKSLPLVESFEALAPAIVYNVGKECDRLFFSGTKDSDGIYHGTWSNTTLKYHDWFHVALAVTSETVIGYIDGEVVALGEMLPPVNGKRTCSYYDPLINVTSPSNSENTILRIAGGIGLASTTGLVADVRTFSNIALTKSLMFAVMNDKKPRNLPIVHELMTHFGIGLWDNICLQHWEKDDYLQCSWGLCPESICGKQCMSDSFLVGGGQYDSDHHSCVWKNNNHALRERHIYHHDKLCSDDSCSDVDIVSIINRIPTRDLLIIMDSSINPENFSSMKMTNDIETLLTMISEFCTGEPTDHTSEYETQEIDYCGELELLIEGAIALSQMQLTVDTGLDNDDSRGLSADTTESFPLLVKSHSKSDNRRIGDIGTTRSGRAKAMKSQMKGTSNSKPNALYQFMSKIWKKFSALAQPSLVEKPPANDSVAQPPIRSNNLSYVATTLSKQQIVHQLYSNAMMLSHGRHSQLERHAHLSLDHWRADSEDHIIASLLLGLWLADDLQSDPANDDGEYWPFRYSSLMSQPFHLALGHRSGFDNSFGLNWDRILTSAGDEALLVLPKEMETNSLSSLVNSIVDSSRKDVKEFALIANHREQIDDDKADSHFAAFPAHSSDILDWVNVIRTLDKSGYIHPNGSVNQLLDKYVAAGLSILDVHALQANCYRHKDAMSLAQSMTRPAISISQKMHQRLNTEEQELESARFMASECKAAAASYFPVTQFVASHFGELDSGVGIYEDVRLDDTSSDIWEKLGEDSSMHHFKESDALAGNADAQMWLGRRYYWGHDGILPDIHQAQRWFEMAAEQGNAEGLYNVGVFYLHGVAGQPDDQEKAFNYFLRAANSSRPFPMALHAVGNFYQDKKFEHYDVLKAFDYFAKAAALGSTDGHFSLAMLFCDEHFMELKFHHKAANVPKCLIQLSLAASAGHIRSLNYLAHALYDEQSWLMHHIRDWAMGNLDLSFFDLSAKNVSYSAKIKNSPYAHWHWNSSVPIRIVLTEQIWQLPAPYGNGSACETALAMMKQVVEHSYRPNDLMDAGLTAYSQKQLYTALQYYDEASELGVLAAQENSALIYAQLELEQCGARPDDWREGLSQQLSNYWDVTFGIAMPLVAQKNVEDPGFHLDKEKCHNYYQRMIRRRRMQMANQGEPVAMRQIADELMKDHGDNKRLEATVLFAVAAENGDMQAVVQLGFLYDKFNQEISRDDSIAMGKSQSSQRCTAVTRAIFGSMRKLEKAYDSVGEGSTQGVAPALIDLYCEYSDHWDNWQHLPIRHVEMIENYSIAMLGVLFVLLMLLKWIIARN